MDDTKADRLPRARPGQIPARPDRVHQQRRRSPERDYSRRSNLLGTPETASSDRDPCPRQSASFDPPQQCKNHRCETHTKQSVFTQPGSKADKASCLDFVRFTPESRQAARASECPLCANSNRRQRSKIRAYSITSSARASSVGGSVMPRTLAVIRLMISSTFTACWTG